jgi:lipopolysaccharide/colanic/teichoic acid biosynthesis glycosyltransferase
MRLEQLASGDVFWRRGDLVKVVSGTANLRFAAFVSRLIDIAVSVSLLVICLPLVVVVAAAIKFDSRGSVFFRCRRVGFRGSELQMLKFRKMHEGATGAAVTLSADARFTRVGRVLARMKIDELPQLWNVLKGEMTLVGPRPEHPGFVAIRQVDYEKILTVKPGITGLCQLAFAKEGEVLDEQDSVRDYIERLLPQKAALDLLYVGRRSLPMDLKILVWTAVAVFLRRDVAVHRADGSLGVRRRPQESAVAVAAGMSMET